jgi:hypothetical protein
MRREIPESPERRSGTDPGAMAQKTRQGTSTRAERQRSTCLSMAAAHLGSTIHPHESPRPASATGVTTSTPDAGWIRSSYRLLMIRGLSPVEAGNVVAYVAGLHAAEGGWSVRQIEQLVALRSLVGCGVIAS